MRMRCRQRLTVFLARHALCVLVLALLMGQARADNPCADLSSSNAPKITILSWALSSQIDRDRKEPSDTVYYRSNSKFPATVSAEVLPYVWTKLLIEQRILDHLAQCGALPFTFRWHRPKDQGTDGPDQAATPQVSYKDLVVDCGAAFPARNCKIIATLKSEAASSHGAFTWRTWAHRELALAPGPWVVTVYYANGIKVQCQAIPGITLPSDAACEMLYTATTSTVQRQ